jgi:uncharacterized membrane protein
MGKILNDHNLAAARLSTKRWNVTLGGVVVLYFFLTLAISLSYHWGYLSTLTDVGTFDQAVWATLRGFPFLNTNAFSSPVNYFGIHFRPILAIFLPFYALLPRVEWMIAAQSFALAITAWPIYLLGLRVLKVEIAAFCIVLAYLINPFILSVPPWVFRPESLVVPFIALAMLGVEKANFRLTLLSCLVAVLCKEHFGIMVVGVGILWWLRNHDLAMALILVGFGLLYSLIVLIVIMPALSPIDKHVMLGSDMGQLSRYNWLGGGWGEIAQKIFRQPFAVGKTIMEMGGGIYLLLLMILFLGMPLVGAEFLLPGLADFAANLLSANPLPRSVISYHSVSLVPVITVAAIYGLNRISLRMGRFSVKELTIFTLVVGLSSGYLMARHSLPWSYWAPARLMNAPESAVSLIKRLVGDEASVSAQANVGAHFSQRQQIFQYPNKVGEVDAIILRLASPTRKIAPATNYTIELKSITGSLDAHLQMNRHEYIESIEKLLEANEYGVLLWKAPWLVLSRTNRDNSNLGEIKKKLVELKEEWKIGLVPRQNL